MSLPMLRRMSKLKCTEKTLAAALRKRGIWLRAMRGKPQLTNEDVKERFAFTKNYHKKPCSWWIKHMHLAIGLKKFPVCPPTCTHGRTSRHQHG